MTNGGGNLRVLRDNYVIFGINFALMGVSSNDGKQLAHFRRFWGASHVDICAPRGVFTLMAANWPLMSVNVFGAMGAMSVNGLATAQLWKNIKGHWGIACTEN